MTSPSEVAATLRADVDAVRRDMRLLRQLPTSESRPLEALLWKAVETLRVELEDAASNGHKPSQACDASSFVQSTAFRHPLESLVHELSPPLDVPTPDEVLQARRNAKARAELLREFGALTSAEVADFVGSEARNRSSLAHRWRKEGRLLAVPYRGTLLYPGFQFHDGEVLPHLADVLRHLSAGGLTDWETALWFTARNGWLDDRRPVNLLVEDPGRVVEAARHEVSDFGG